MAKQTLVAVGAADEIKNFSYSARKADGKMVTGTAKAVNANDVTDLLLRQHLTPIKVKERTGSGGGPKRAEARALVVAARQLSVMIDAGLQYPEAIEVVRADCEDLALAAALREVSVDIQNGEPLSAGMAKHPYVFPEIMVNLVAAGEASGTVREAMLTVADSLEKADELRAKVKKAAMYPVIVLIIASLIFTAMMLFIVPAFADTYLELSNGEVGLPMLTQIVVNISEIMKWAVPASVIPFIIFVVWYRRNAREDWMRKVVDPLKFKLPVFGKLFHKMSLARFCSTMAGLEAAGVPRLDALTISARTVGNIVMEKALLTAREAQARGEQLAPVLAEEPLFPNMVITMVKAGERSGSVATMLEKSGEIYDRDVDQITDNMAELINPVMLTVVGVMVCVLVIAIYLPYIKIGGVI